MAEQENATGWHDEVANKVLRFTQPKPELRNTLREDFVSPTFQFFPPWIYTVALTTVFYRIVLS
jgi:hypothetical protein